MINKIKTSFLKKNICGLNPEQIWEEQGNIQYPFTNDLPIIIGEELM